MSKISRVTSKAIRLAKNAVDGRSEVADYALVSLHCLRVYLDKSYRDSLDLLSEMPQILAEIGLDEANLPHHSTLVKAFDRLKTALWRVLLRLSAQLHDPSGHAAIDATFFDHRSVSSYYRQRSGSTVQTLKVTTVTDRESLAVLDVHISARWKHDTKTGPQVVAGTRTTCCPWQLTKLSTTGTRSTSSTPSVSIHSSYSVDRHRLR